MEKRSLWFFLVGFGLFLFIGMGANAQTKDQPIVVKAVTAFPTNHAGNDPVWIFVERVNKLAKGRLKIDWLGGPEVIKTFDQIHALKAGTIDALLHYSCGYLKSLMPEAEAKGLSELAEWEERKTGAYDLWCEIFAKRVNAKYLGRLQQLIPFMVYSNKKIEKIDDFKGLKIRVMPLCIPFIKSLGAVPVTTPPTELYTTMERGVVDGFMWPRFGMVSWGLQEVTKYVMEPGVFQMDPAIMVNMDKWNKIPKDLQELIIDVEQDIEYAGVARGAMITAKEDIVRKKAGMKYIQLPPEDAERFVKICYDKTWEYVLESAREYGPKLRQLSSKKALPKGAFPWMAD